MLERFLDQIGEVLRLCEDTDGILVVNREGIIEYHRIPLNSYWCSQDTVGRHILELYPELDGESSTIRQRSTDLRNLFGLPSIRFTINGAEAEPGSPSGGSLSGEGLSGRSRLYTISGTGALSREDREDLYVISGAGSIDRMGEQTEAWMRTVRDDPGLTGAEKLQKMFRASLENSDQTDLFVLAPNMLKNPKLMSILLESMIGEVLPNYMEPVLREAVADGSIRTDYPEELGELLLLLSNVWLNPMIYPATPEKTRRRMELYDQMLRSMGLDLLDQELLNQWERFCRLSQERL